MRSSHWSVVLVLVGLVVGVAVGGGVFERRAEAHGVPISPQPARFQISAYGYGSAGAGNPAGRGCYIVAPLTRENLRIALIHGRFVFLAGHGTDGDLLMADHS